MKILACIVFAGVVLTTFATAIPDIRPKPSKRKFSSEYVEKTIDWMSRNLKTPELAQLFSNCYPNTLDTTVLEAGTSGTFIITGDIEAMWLRDSLNQVLPYIPLVKYDTKLREMIQGTIVNHLRYVLHDPYANAFNQKPDGSGWKDTRKPAMTPLVFEGKYELDSIASVLKLARTFAAAMGQSTNTSFIVSTFPDYLKAVDKILSTLDEMQMGTEELIKKDIPNPYMFFRDPNEYYPGVPAAHTGMFRSAFRPSDDRTTFDFLIPSNFMMAVELRHTMALLAAGQDAETKQLYKHAERLLRDVTTGLLVNFHAAGGKHLAYEVDGFTKWLFMDDANVPSLLSLPLLGVTEEAFPGFNANYAATRAAVLSKENPYYVECEEARGVGSPHTPGQFIWPIGLMVQIMTSPLINGISDGGANANKKEATITELLSMVVASAKKTGAMHEGFECNNPDNFTRSWFAWANTVFGQTMLTLVAKIPQEVLKPDAEPIPSWFPKPPF